ncbi:ATP-binding cassette domain-containing protein [Aerococcus agrisoli]|uniref:ATP-binding cassette domain-containing protein n=1 Tax=Aerococcus agrisoli TaxID=2487350 RepID=A0A3N4GHU7_9LACT|nr:ABC transporter ATP-binding protein [Aerococcus agrisoli]RPA61278.1 ATP-binding cassette domain-containing protein [Aerococcus agrisoli]
MLQVEHLRKTFGNKVAVDDVSFEIQPGTILGIVGQNGSGKTTIFRMILNFLTPENNGRVMWQNEPMHMKTVYNTVGYLPEERGLYEKMTIEQQIMYFARLRGMKKADVNAKIDEWMDKFNVKGNRKDKIKTLSKGNQQKVQLIATLIHEPVLVILDEPFSGLDPVNAEYLMQGILELRDKGSCIIFSSHNMSNVQSICDTVIMIDNGQQKLYGTIEDVRNSYGKTRLFVKADGWDADKLVALEGVDAVTEVTAGEYKLILADESFGKNLFNTISQGQYIQEFSQQPPTLDEIFKMEAGGKHEQ